MFQTCVVIDRHKGSISKAAKLMLSPGALSQYKDVSSTTGVPWYAIAALHYREANLNFFGHLHNGDRLDRKTRLVPANRPKGIWPPVPFEPRSAWKLSAIDALKDFPQLRSNYIEYLLFYFEAYNGWGFRYHRTNSAYVWSFSNFYQKGGYARDGQWSNDYVSKQAGLGLIIKALAEAAPNEVDIRFEV